MNINSHAENGIAARLRHDLGSEGNEWAKHFQEIQSIAQDMSLPIAEIALLYENVFEDLSAYAEVTDFLPVFVSKKVRELCRKRS